MDVVPRFSIRSLFLATSMTAAGLTVLAFPAGRENIPSMAALALIGAGIWTLFNRPWVGAVIGALIPPVAISMAYALHWWHSS